jgi:hypothetical protein
MVNQLIPSDFNYRNLKQTSDETGKLINPEGNYTTQQFKYLYEIDDCNNSQIEVAVYPSMPGKYWVHVLIGNTEILESP